MQQTLQGSILSELSLQKQPNALNLPRNLGVKLTKEGFDFQPTELEILAL
jgi:hypothetical protein